MRSLLTSFKHQHTRINKSKQKTKLTQPDKHPRLIHAYQKMLCVGDDAGIKTRSLEQIRISRNFESKAKVQKVANESNL